jgi:hypothetical protein
MTAALTELATMISKKITLSTEIEEREASPEIFQASAATIVRAMATILRIAPMNRWTDQREMIAATTKESSATSVRSSVIWLRIATRQMVRAAEDQWAEIGNVSSASNRVIWLGIVT